MRVSFTLQHNENQGLVIEFTRICLFLIILMAGVISTTLQAGFLNWDLLAPFYAIIAVALGLHLLWVAGWSRWIQKANWLFVGFALDSLFISLLIYYSGVNQSLFLFLHLVNILLAGIACQTMGAVSIALFTSIFFTAATILSPEAKALNSLLLLALNNIAFFSVAGLSGYLSEQLQSVGRELTKTGLSLRSAQELNRVILNNMPSGMISFTPTGEIIQANPSASEILERPQLLQSHWQDLFPEFDLAQKGVFKGDLKYKIGEASKIIGVTVTSLHSPELQQDISIAVLDDLTKMRQLEYSARQNEKMAAVGGLAAGIAHEIRNPLAGISGSIELLTQTVDNDDDRKLMKIILREIDRLNNLITEFLDYSRPEKPPTDSVDLAVVLTEVLDAMNANNQVRKDIVQERGYQQDLKILGHRDKLKQAFLNIILNSYQAMNDAGKPSLTVQGSAVDKSIQIRIRDTGSGMSEATRKKMFEPFHTTKPKGTGLGLAVTHKILEGHGAQIFVESEQGVGTEFILNFPRANT